MKVWVDPKETAAGAWGGVDDDSAAAAAAPSAPAIERAVSTRAPVQYTDGASLTPTAERAEGGNGTNTHASNSTARSTVGGR